MVNAAWDARQRAYVTKWGRNGIFTPQVIVDGVVDGVGRQDGEVMEIFSKGIEARNAMDWTVGLEKISNNELKIASERSGSESFDVIHITYDPKPETVK